MISIGTTPKKTIELGRLPMGPDDVRLSYCTDHTLMFQTAEGIGYLLGDAIQILIRFKEKP